MTTSKLLAAFILSAAVAAPAVAKDKVQTHTTVKQHRVHNAKMMKKNHTARADWHRHGRRDSGFWPGQVAAGAVGTAGAIASGALNTAGAIATAPFRDSYASYDGPYYRGYGYDDDAPYPTGAFMGGTNNMAPKSTNFRASYSGGSFACGPGGWYVGGDGLRHPCPY